MIAFTPLTEDALAQVLAWRTDPAVSRYLLTDISADRDRHREWFRRVSADPSCVHWLIRRDERNIGLAYLTDIDPARRECSCGFYIGEEGDRPTGGVVFPGIVNHVFGAMDFRKLRGEVLAGNDNVLRMHALLGYRQVEVLPDHVLKRGVSHDLHLFELTRERWQQMADFYRPYRIPVVDAGGGRS